MKILITGSTGFIGSHLVEELVGEHQVCALVRSPEKLKRFSFCQKIGIIRGDLFDSEPFPPDTEAIIHLAAITKAITPSEFMKVNQHGASCFLDRAAGLKRLKTVIQLSSIAAAGPSACEKPLTEDMEPHPVSLYGKSKLLEEKTFREKSPAPLIIVRAPIVFGPRDMDMLDAFRLLKKGFLPVLSSKNRYYSVIYVKDLVRGIKTILEHPLGSELFYLTSGVPVEWIHFMETAAGLLGRVKIRKIRVPHLAARVLAEISEWRCQLFRKRAIFNRDKFREMKHPCWLCSGGKIERLLHFSPHFGLEEALAETVGYYRREGLL